MNVPGSPLPQKIWSRGPKVLLMGAEGTGKTDAIRTIIESGLKCFVAFIEPGMEVLTDSTRGRKVYTCKDGLHWSYTPIAQPTFRELADGAMLLNKFSYKALSEMAPMNREKYQAWYHYIGLMGNLKCDRCNEVFGPADQLPYDEWCVVNDSLTSISKAALLCHIGSKPGVHQGEYGNSMRSIESYIDKFVGDMPCMGVMLAHIDKEPDPLSGGLENMVATLGQKLAPKIPRPFSDVVLAKREADKFTWSTTESGYRLKTRNFAFSSAIAPSFKPMIEAWRKKIQAEKDGAAANEQVKLASPAK